jgi:putative endopeptidase
MKQSSADTPVSRQDVQGILAVCLLAALLLSSPQMNAQRPSEPSTEQQSALDERIMDKTADPCEDFNRYACGNFKTFYPLPETTTSFGTFDLLEERNAVVLRSILEAATSAAKRSTSEQQLGDYYAACMDTETIDRLGLKPLKREMVRIDEMKKKSDLPIVMAQLILIRANAFFDFGPEQDPKDARQEIALIAEGGYQMPNRDSYLNAGIEDKRLRTQYLQHIARELRLAGETDTEAQSDAVRIMAIETKLAASSLDVVTRRDPNETYHLLTIQELSALTPRFSWTTFLTAVGAPPTKSIDVSNPAGLQAFDRVLQGTNLADIKAYLRWTVISHLSNLWLPEPFQDESFNFDGRILRGQPERTPRWQACTYVVWDVMADTVSKAYVAAVFPEAKKAEGLSMVHDIEAAMSKDIDESDWMDQRTKARAKEKLRSITNKVGYPDKWVDYGTLEVRRDDALGNLTRGWQLRTTRDIQEIGQPVDKRSFELPVSLAAAYYSAGNNDVNIMAGMMQRPFYDLQASDAANYGHLGAIVGHELVHGFDDKGRLYNGDGNLEDWWTPEDNKRFKQKASCFVNEYGALKVDELHVNGTLSLGENLADNGGLQLAYLAMIADALRKHLDMQSKTDGLTPKQQFFLAFAQDWCNETREEQLRLQVQTNPHTPDIYRGNGALQNMPEFGEAFGCKRGQPMMPAESCRVW